MAKVPFSFSESFTRPAAAITGYTTDLGNGMRVIYDSRRYGEFTATASSMYSSGGYAIKTSTTHSLGHINFGRGVSGDDISIPGDEDFSFSGTCQVVHPTGSYQQAWIQISSGAPSWSVQGIPEFKNSLTLEHWNLYGGVLQVYDWYYSLHAGGNNHPSWGPLNNPSTFTVQRLNGLASFYWEGQLIGAFPFPYVVDGFHLYLNGSEASPNSLLAIYNLSLTGVSNYTPRVQYDDLAPSGRGLIKHSLALKDGIIGPSTERYQIIEPQPSIRPPFTYIDPNDINNGGMSNAEFLQLMIATGMVGPYFPYPILQTMYNADTGWLMGFDATIFKWVKVTYVGPNYSG